MAVLASGPPDVLRAAIANEQTEVLTRVPGVGARTAKAIILHLKDKVGGGLAPAAVTYLTDADAELLSALTGLGYSVVEAQAALTSLPHDPSLTVEERLRQALAYFARP
jgi:Holliday junction DNA helicase RuvA